LIFCERVQYFIPVQYFSIYPKLTKTGKFTSMGRKGVILQITQVCM